jgi:hypothetical protein
MAQIRISNMSRPAIRTCSRCFSRGGRKVVPLRRRVQLPPPEHVPSLPRLLGVRHSDAFVGPDRYESPPERQIGPSDGALEGFCRFVWRVLRSWSYQCAFMLFLCVYLLKVDPARYLNDLWVFDTQEYKWCQVEFKETELKPSFVSPTLITFTRDSVLSARSGFSFLPCTDGIVLHGGFPSCLSFTLD